MKITCSNCFKVYNIPDEKLPKKDSIAFNCPACSNKIKIQLKTGSSGEKPLNKESSSNNKKRVVFSPVSDKDPSRLFGDDLKKKIIQTLDNLPPMPKIVDKSRQIMADPKSGFKEIANIIETDQAIAARVLKMANSAYYGLSGMVSSIHQATVVLGYSALEELITMVAASSLLGSRLKGYGMSAGVLWKHSLAAAFAAKIIAGKRMPTLENDAFSVGLIHDSGKLALDKYILMRKEQMNQYMRENKQSFLDAEQAVLGVDHAQISGELCRKWKLPEKHALAMQYHHNPSALKENDLACIIHIADYIAFQCDLDSFIDAALYQPDEKAMEKLQFDENDLLALVKEVGETLEQVTQAI